MIQENNSPFNLKRIFIDPAFFEVRILAIFSSLLSLLRFLPGYTLWLGCESYIVGNILFVFFETFLVLRVLRISSIGRRSIVGVFWGVCFGVVPDIAITIINLIYDFVFGGFKIALIVVGIPIRPFTISDIWSVFVSNMIFNVWMIIVSAFVGFMVSFIRKPERKNR
jgi:hypothetical protein